VGCGSGAAEDKTGKIIGLWSAICKTINNLLGGEGEKNR